MVRTRKNPEDEKSGEPDRTELSDDELSVADSEVAHGNENNS
jgi:hypothetical protein